MELLTLPEPARSLWQRAGQALQNALRQTDRPPERWSIGGGSILAQRWAHRESTDIDLTVPPGTGILALDERVGGTLKADMYALGARDVTTGRTRHRIVFDNGIIDIAELGDRPESGQTTAIVERHEADVKSTTQILRGKLERALKKESPARDLFDIAVAHHADPDALACAVNMIGEEEIRQVKTHWRINAHRLEQEAKGKLANIDPEHEPERRYLIDRAIGRLEDARYQAVQIEVAVNRITVRMRTGGARTKVLHIEQAELIETLVRRGMREFLNHSSRGGCRRLLQKAEAAAAESRGQTVILEWTA